MSLARVVSCSGLLRHRAPRVRLGAGSLSLLALFLLACADPTQDGLEAAQDTSTSDLIGVADTTGQDLIGDDDGGSQGGPDALASPDAPIGPEPDPNPGEPFPSALQSQLDDLLASQFDGLGAPGATLTVVIPGHQRYESAMGKASDEPQREMAVGDRMRTGSVTKTYVTAATLQLVEEGAIGLDDPIDLWVSDYSMGAGITLRRLLNHTSGIPNYTDDPNFLSKVFGHGEPQDVIDFALEMGMLFSPGDGFTYSNTNFYFLGLMLESVTGLDVHQVLRERLLEPYDLGDTFFEGAEPIDGPYVEGYLAGAPAPLTDMSWAWAAGAMVADGSDLCAWLDLLYRGEVLSGAHRDFMMTRTKLWGGSTVVDYGAGTEILTQQGRDVFGHTGSTVGGQCEIYIEPDSGVCVALMTNDFFATPKPANSAAWSLVMSYVDTQ